MSKNPIPRLSFEDVVPRAVHGLGGPIQNHFSHGRLAVTAAAHGGLTNISFAGTQHLGAFRLFQGDAVTAWNKLFRVCIQIGGKSYYPVLEDTLVFPFGLRSRCHAGGVKFEYDLFLLADAIVQRVRVLENKAGHPIGLRMLHQEAVTAVTMERREWSEMKFDPAANAVITCCTDRNPGLYRGDDSLAQRGYGLAIKDGEHSTTWVGLGGEHPMLAHRGYHPRSKHYLTSQVPPGCPGAFFVAFAPSRPKLRQRLSHLRRHVHEECDRLVEDYYARLARRPKIKTGSKVLDSAFTQYPEMLHANKIPDRPGAVKATMTGYFVWGWDGMMSIIPSVLANEPDFAAKTLRFYQETRNPRVGLPHAYTTKFLPKLKGPFPSQCQFIAGLYHLVAMTGDLAIAREMWPTCQFLLDRCRRDEVRNTGLVAGHALWPDFPEAMGEDGNDISSLNNSLLYQGLRSMEYLAAALGRPRVAAECREWAKRLRQNFVRYLYDEEKGFFISSCSAIDLKPRKHYCAQAVFWLTPFARELVSHAPARISAFIDRHLRSKRCLLTLPHWDTAWMADGNQLGSSFPAADTFYLGVHKAAGQPRALDVWLGDVEWFWNRLTAPEAFTPEAENEDDLGPDNAGCKQTQALGTWYTGLYYGLAGLDFDHEGVTFTPWGDRPLEIRGLMARGKSLDIAISGRASHVGSIRLNGRLWPKGLYKIPWSAMKGRKVRIEFHRTQNPPGHPVVLRADGLGVRVISCDAGKLKVSVSGMISGEMLVRAQRNSRLFLDGTSCHAAYDAATGTFCIPFEEGRERKVELVEAASKEKLGRA